STSRAPFPDTGWKAPRLYVGKRYAASRASTAAGVVSYSILLIGSRRNQQRSSFTVGENRGVSLRPGDDDLRDAGGRGRKAGVQLGPHAARHGGRGEERL